MKESLKQAILKYTYPYYNSEIDGIIGKNTNKAISQYEKDTGTKIASFDVFLTREAERNLVFFQFS